VTTRPVALRPPAGTAIDASRRPPASRPAPTAQTPRPAVSGLAGDVVDIVRALPAAILWALIGSLALALGLAGNAFWQSRRRTALERQRIALLEDIGLLSSALLPPMPDGLDGLTVSAAYEPAEGPAAGGDFYDVFVLGDERVGVLLGDVSGHGRASLRHAALARYTLRTLLADGHGPGEALARADALLSRELPPHFVTVIAAVYDHSTGELAYAKAGHAPPIVLGAPYDGAAEQPACPIGLGLGATWPEYRLELAAGVTVGLVTDGLEDARAGDKRLGRVEVVRLLAAQAEPDAATLLGGVRELADSLPDDTAAVVLTRRAS
jgi:serine phosphatase RsbU (regulator of sigma subunit)